jgi:hypothetical protein
MQCACACVGYEHTLFMQCMPPVPVPPWQYYFAPATRLQVPSPQVRCRRQAVHHRRDEVPVGNEGADLELRSNHAAVVFDLLASQIHLLLGAGSTARAQQHRLIPTHAHVDRRMCACVHARHCMRVCAVGGGMSQWGRWGRRWRRNPAGAWNDWLCLRASTPRNAFSSSWNNPRPPAVTSCTCKKRQ